MRLLLLREEINLEKVLILGMLALPFFLKAVAFLKNTAADANPLALDHG